MMIEQNTNYAYKLKYMNNPTFDKVRDLSTKFYRELPQALQDELFEALNRGIDILDSEPQMTAYLFAFGKMHQAKLNYAFGKLPEEFLEQPEINIIDYGCGQALGTMCYIDFLNKNNYWQKVNSITLIDPSEICLKRAALHVSVFFPEARIITINKRFNDLNERDIACNEWLDGLYMRREIEENELIPKLHIFSNVLDINSFNMSQLANLIKGRMVGYNQFVCVGPFFHSDEKDNRMSCFSSLFCNDCFFETLDKGGLDAKKEWTCSTSIFSFGKMLNWSTKVTNEDLNEAEEVDGPAGYRYNYGVRLLKLSDFDCDILPGTRVICCKALSQDAWINAPLLEGNIQVRRQIIGRYAFQSQWIKGVDVNCLSIEDGAFENCQDLKSIHISKSVRFIGGNPFAKCPQATITSDSSRFIVQNDMLIDRKEKRLICYFGNAESVIIPNTIANIGYKAFAGKAIKHLTIPNSVVSIGANPFDGCKDITVSSQSTRYIVSNEMLIDTQENRLITYFGNEESINIPKTIQAIGSYSFCGKQLKLVYIPNSVSNIGEGAFSSCISLQQVVLPDTITRIEDETFSWCTSLQIVKMPQSLSSIGDGAFYECSNLHHIVFPKTLTFIGHRAFSWCTSLEQIVLPNALKSIGGEAFSHCGLKHIVVPNSVHSFGDHVFEGSSLVQAIIPDLVISMNKGHFESCSSLQQIIIKQYENGEVEATIPDNTFDGCSSLRQIILPETINRIGKRAFQHCWALESINLTCCVLGIGEYAFHYCTSLQSVEMPAAQNIEKGAFNDCKSLRKVVLPYGVESICEDAFRGCGIREVVLPETISTIGENALRCTETKKVIYETYVENGETRHAFHDADELLVVLGRNHFSQSFHVWRDTLQKIVIPKGTTEKFKEILDMKLWDKLVEE